MFYNVLFCRNQCLFLLIYKLERALLLLCWNLANELQGDFCLLFTVPPTHIVLPITLISHSSCHSLPLPLTPFQLFFYISVCSLSPSPPSHFPFCFSLSPKSSSLKSIFSHLILACSLCLSLSSSLTALSGWNTPLQSPLCQEESVKVRLCVVSVWLCVCVCVCNCMCVCNCEWESVQLRVRVCMYLIERKDVWVCVWCRRKVCDLSCVCVYNWRKWVFVS